MLFQYPSRLVAFLAGTFIIVCASAAAPAHSSASPKAILTINLVLIRRVINYVSP
jgi:hypothetical protein